MYRRRLVYRRVASIALALLVALPLFARSGEAQTDANNDPARLRALAGRLLTPPNTTVSGRTATSELLVGQLPTDLPLSLPLLPGTQVVGAIVYRFDNAPSIWEVVLDVPGTLADTTNGFDRELPPQGWAIPPSFGRSFGPTGGFATTTQGAGFRTYCQTGTGTSLALTAYAAAPTNDVRVRVDAVNRGGCAAVSPSQQQAAVRLPDLVNPPNVSVQPGGASISNNIVTSQAVATTTASVGDLEAAYAAQLRNAGWVRLDGGATDRFAWSVWNVPGIPEMPGQTQGFFYALAQAEPDQRSLFVQVRAPLPPMSPMLPPPPPNPPPGQTVIPGGGTALPLPLPRDAATAVAMTVGAIPRPTVAGPVGPFPPVSTASFPPFGPNTPTPVLPTAVPVPRTAPVLTATPAA